MAGCALPLATTWRSVTDEVLTETVPAVERELSGAARNANQVDRHAGDRGIVVDGAGQIVLLDHMGNASCA